MKRDDFRTLVRAHVIGALDRSIRDITKTPNAHGWEDKDLPDLFPAIDRQADRIAERHGVKLED